MTILALLSRLLQLLGYARGAAFLWEKHEAKVKAKEIAEAPTTRAELEKTLRDGKL